mgnify:CR=1 FL=1
MVEVKGYTDFRLIGATRDDAAGEAFDKAARTMGIPYPGGLNMDKLAKDGDNTAYKFPTPKVEGCPYDFIILDPPAFTKSRDTLRNAIKGYREINAAAMKLLPRGGYLATCSCSHFMTDTYFKQMLHNAAEDAGVSLRQIEARQQGPDHPILWNVPETDYLGFYIFQIV